MATTQALTRKVAPKRRAPTAPRTSTLKSLAATLFLLAWLGAVAAALLKLANLFTLAVLAALLALGLGVFAPRASPAAPVPEARSGMVPMGATLDDAPFTTSRAPPRPIPVESRAAPLRAAPPRAVAVDTKLRPIDRPAEIPAPRVLPRSTAGLTHGKCGGCGATLTLPATRPIQATCPGCGRSKLLV